MAKLNVSKVSDAVPNLIFFLKKLQLKQMEMEMAYANREYYKTIQLKKEFDVLAIRVHMEKNNLLVNGG
jgi:hypothetical protein